jgi:hypothetical protein
MSKKLFNGPLFFIILGGLVLLAYRYLPFESLLEKIKAGRGDAQITEQAAPPVAEQRPVDSAPAPVAPAVPQETERSLADSEPPPAAPASASALPGTAVGSAAVTTMPPVPTASPQPPAVAVPEARSPPPPAVVPEQVSPVEKAAPRVVVPPKVQASKPKPPQDSVAQASEPPTVAAAGKPALSPETVLPNLRVFVQADVHERAGLGDLSADRYAELLKAELTAVAGDYIGREAVQSEDPNMMFRDYLAEGREGLGQICKLAGAQRVLLADVEIAAAGFSSVDSAYWPEVSYIAINCGDGRVHKSAKKRLEPHRLDAFEFQQQFSRRAQEFIASQGYFLKP